MCVRKEEAIAVTADLVGVLGEANSEFDRISEARAERSMRRCSALGWT
jgi:hypothetical protein